MSISLLLDIILASLHLGDPSELLFIQLLLIEFSRLGDMSLNLLSDLKCECFGVIFAVLTLNYDCGEFTTDASKLK